MNEGEKEEELSIIHQHNSSDSQSNEELFAWIQINEY